MEIGRISYEDKKDYKIEGTDDRFRVTANDMNQIKSVFNDSAETIELTEKKVDEAVSFIGTYKIEGGLIYFKQADGTFGPGIALAGQTSIVLDDVVQENVTLSSTTEKDNKILVHLVIGDKEYILPTTAENVKFVNGRFAGKTAKEVIDNSVQFISNNDDGTVTVDIPD